MTPEERTAVGTAGAAPEASSLWHTMGADEVVSALRSDSARGLSADEARERLERMGPNELEPPAKTPAWKMFLLQFNDFMIWVLMVAVLISVFEGQWIESIAILAILLLNGVLGFIQEYRAEQALEALKQMSAPSATVLRDGAERAVPARELVPGDVVKLEAGDKIPADGRLLEVGALRCEEAALTGESKPSRKSVDYRAEALSALGDRDNMVFAGTSVAVGRGTYVVTDTGQSTQIGHIATMLSEQEETDTPLQVELEKVGKRIAILVLAIAGIVFVTGWLKGDELTENLLIAISLAVAAIPEGLPAIVTVALSLGVRKMAERNAIVRKLHAVETLGSTSFICSDKTGTLTQNIMTVREILVGTDVATVIPAGDIVPADGAPDALDQAKLFSIAVSCNDARMGADDVLLGDPTETALISAARTCSLSTVPLMRLGEMPFESERKRMSTVHEIDGVRTVFTKGGVDVVLALCDRALVRGAVVPMDDAIRTAVLSANESFASKGNRTLAFAYRDLAVDEAVEGDHLEKGLVYVGVMAMLDPPRPEVVAAISECKTAGIRVAMVTGDHALTARAIAEEIGLETDHPVVTGTMLEAMDDDELYGIVEDTHIYARVNPEHKLRIVDALKRRGHIVAMTGDGVNDAPALKKADIGIAMGKVGTDVSREAADMVLADDNFATIVTAVEQGRVVFDNLRKFILFLLSCNMSEVLIIFITTLVAAFVTIEHAEGPALLALQILWINLVTDGMPALALGVDPGSPRVMERKPRNANESILTGRSLSQVFAQGSFITIGALLMYYGIELGWFGTAGDPTHANTMLFTTVVLAQLMHAFSFRSSTRSVFSAETFRNKWLNLAVLGSITLHTLVIYVPGLQGIFNTQPLTLIDWIEVIIAALVPLVLNDVFKAIRARKDRAAAQA